MNQLQAYSNPTYGLLLPNPVMFSWLGTNDAQTRSLRDSGTVTEGTDYIRHSPHQNLPKERQPIFWTLAGLYKLCGLLGTPQAQQFRVLLDQFVQAPGALVPATPQTLTPPVFEQYQEYQEPIYYPAPYAPAYSTPTPAPSQPAQTLAQQQAATLVANALAPQLAARIEAVNTRQQRDQVELMQRQQQLDLEAFQTHTAVILAAQQQAVEGVRDVVSNLPVSDLYVETRSHSPTWFDKLNQDPLALALVSVALVLGTGLMSFLLFSAVRPNPSYTPSYQPSLQRSY